MSWSICSFWAVSLLALGLEILLGAQLVDTPSIYLNLSVSLIMIAKPLKKVHPVDSAGGHLSLKNPEDIPPALDQYVVISYTWKLSVFSILSNSLSDRLQWSQLSLTGLLSPKMHHLGRVSLHFAFFIRLTNICRLIYGKKMLFFHDN